MPLGGLVTAGIVAGGAIAGNASKNAANKSINDRLSEQMGDQVTFDPELLKRKIYKQYQVTGIMTPEMEQALNMADQQLAIAKTDPEAQRAQKQALQMFGQKAQVGMTPLERAQLASVQQQAAQDSESKRQQILQSMQQRGQGGSGGELAAALGANQAAASTASQGALQASAAADQARMAALSQYGGLAGNIRDSSYRESAGEADARNALARFNLENQRSVQQRNVGTKNTSQELNLRRGWNVADRNVDSANKAIDDQETARYKRMGLDSENLGRRNTARGMMNTQDAAQGAQRAQMWNQLGQAAGGMTSGMGGGSSTTASNQAGGDEYSNFNKYKAIV